LPSEKKAFSKASAFPAIGKEGKNITTVNNHPHTRELPGHEPRISRFKAIIHWPKEIARFL
jgi:hypothetical protein